jgi:cytoskeletal protein CcmA (bactofilin family)
MFGKGSRKLETIIGDGTRIVGKMSVKGTIRLDGIVEGDVQADWVVVGVAGKIQGNILTRGVVVGGSVEGIIEATETAELRENARVVGEIHAPKLAISEGAFFDGRARMKTDAEPAAVQEGNVRSLIPGKAGT